MEKVKIGNIFNTHGLKGEVKIMSSSDDIKKRLEVGKTVFVLFQDEYIELVVKTARFHKEVMLVSFDGMQDINLVEKFKGSTLYIDATGIDDGHVYFFQLVGCEVYDQHDNLLGIVEDVLETGANAVLRVNKTILIPYVDAFILKEDIKHKYLQVEVIEGML